MTTDPYDPSSSAEADEASAIGGISDPDRPSNTYLADWVMMTRGVPFRAKEYYWALRSWIFEKDPSYVVYITDPEMAEFLDCSVRSVERAREDAIRAGFIRVCRTIKKQVVVNGRPRDLPIVRQIEVVTDPPEGYQGPVNSVSERKRIQARYENQSPPSKKRKKAASKSGESDQSPPAEGPQNCGPSGDQGNVDNSAAEGGGSADLSDRSTDLSDRATEVSDRPTELPDLTGSDQAQQGPQDERTKTTVPTRADEHLEPFGDTQKVPDLQKVYEKTAGQVDNGVTNQGELVSNHLHAYAREKAGPAAVAAVQANPQISENELAEVIRRSNSGLSRGQAFGRAAALLAHERKWIEEARSCPPASTETG